VDDEPGYDPDAADDEPEDEDDRRSIELRRLPAWDRIYYLWMNPTKRWLNDPRFRRWIAEAVDRKKMLDLLFDGEGTEVYSLFEGGPSERAYELLKGGRPLSDLSTPRLELAYDLDDDSALTIARRYQAILESLDVELVLKAMRHDELRKALSVGELQLAILSHHPATPDPLLAALGTFWWFEPDADDSRYALMDAASEISPDQTDLRLRAALQVEGKLLADIRLVPLVKLHAFLARKPRLSGVAARVDGVLGLEEAWWLPE
jgi:ABC-type transport system substrate-binding protein